MDKNLENKNNNNSNKTPTDALTERLNRINKDYYYKVNPNGTDALDQDVKNINIQVGNVTFTYKLREDDKNN